MELGAIDWVLILICAVSIAFNLFLGHKAKRTLRKARLRENREQLERQVRGRVDQDATAGERLDQALLLERADRLFEGVGDRLRTLATLALAIGLGGTLLCVFAVQIAQYASSDDKQKEQATGSPKTSQGVQAGQNGGSEDLPGGEESQEDVEARVASKFIRDAAVRTGASLVASFVGVAVHIWIVWHLLARAEDKQARWVRALLAQLDREKLSSVALSAPSELPLVLTRREASAPATLVLAIGWLLERFTFLSRMRVEGESPLDKHSQTSMGLGQLDEEQVSDFAEGIRTLVDALNNLQGAPVELRKVLEDNREAWVRELRSVQLAMLADFERATSAAEERNEAWFRKLVEHSAQFTNQAADVNASLAGFPNAMAKEAEGLAKNLGITLTTGMSNELTPALRILGDWFGRLFSEMEAQTRALGAIAADLNRGGGHPRRRSSSKASNGSAGNRPLKREAQFEGNP